MAETAPTTHSSRVGTFTPHPLLGFFLGAISLVVATLALFLPIFAGHATLAASAPADTWVLISTWVSLLACAIAGVGAIYGDRFFAGSTAVMAVFNLFLIAPAASVPFGAVAGRLPATFLAVLLPLVPMILTRFGYLRSFGGPEGAADQPAFVRNPQDFYGGMALLELALIAWRAAAPLPGQQGFAFGPGTAPRLFIMLLALNALGIMLHGMFVAGPRLERWAIRGPLFITAGVLVFAATIRSLGLIPSTFLLVLVSSAATPEVRWVQTVIWGVVLAIFCAILFPYVLNLPMQLWPRF